MDFSEFLRREVGPNWVLAPRRTPRLVERYGESVIVIPHARYKALEERYNAENPCRCGRRSLCCGTCERKAVPA